MIDQNVESTGGVRYPAPLELIHDLRTPLNQIIGYSEILSEQAKEAGMDTFIPDLEKMHAAGKQLLTVIENSFSPLPAVRASADSEPTLAFDSIDTKDLSDIPSLQLETNESARTVLVVDDIEANRDLLTRRLQRLGHTVFTAENGREALSLVGKHPFDLVLLDIMMPLMDGYEVLRRLKTEERSRHIPVVMVSALSELDSVALCIEMGAEDYLTKPINPVLLRARIGSCLEKKVAHDRELELFDQLQQQYEKLQEIELQRDSLTHMIVHDLRTPLTSVIAGMQTLNVVGELNKVQTEMMDISVFGARTLLAMINDLLDVEKLESGSMELAYSEVSVDALVESAFGQVASLAHDKEINLIRKVAPGLDLLCCDEGKLCRTLVNLFGNAIKFTPTQGVITLEADLTEDRQSMAFSVSDTGEGIPTEAFGRIFEKFGQVESRQVGGVASTGLGLTFCKLAVEAHGGHIGVESVAGQGSSFWFTIPLLPQ